jgi:putative spermidine/putrescine transport system permease protein
VEKKFNYSKLLFTAAIIIFVMNICGILFTVILDSFGKSWFSGIVPSQYTLDWYKYAAKNHDILNLIFVTLVVTIAVVLISLLIAFPAAYAMARYKFPFKNAIMTLLLLPMIIPPITYGIPLATVLYKYRFAGRMSGVILANLVPIVPFMILVITPFIEQVSANLESAAKMLGANTIKIFSKVLVPLVMPGILTAGILSVTKTISMFELTYLVAGPKSQTIVVALFADAFAAGAMPNQAVNALAVIYFLITFSCLVVALKFVSPTQMVFKVK